MLNSEPDEIVEVRSVETTERDKIELKWFNGTIKRNTGYIGVEIILVILFIIDLSYLIAAVEWTAYAWRFYATFAGAMVFFFLACEINRHNKFANMTTFFYSWRYPLIAVFFVLAIVDFVILELSDVSDDCDWDDSTTDCPLLNPEEDGIRFMTRTFTGVCLILFLMCVMGYWERFSYVSAHNDWIMALLYLSIIGIVVVLVARWLDPPYAPGDERRKYCWSWHQPRPINRILVIIVKLMIFGITFTVLMGAIVLALFGDAATALGTGAGTVFSIIIFAIIAHVIMITPLAPGSVVDVCAGFLFLSLFVENEGMTVPVAYIVSLAITIVLHFSGSCAQYYVGKMAVAQIWMNRTLPAEMLAASDSVLRDANAIKVGIVGQVFMDTANGLNQGRMNMPFCVQFWSEYASIPTAISLVALGSVLAIPSFDSSVSNNYSWAESAIPLVVMIASLWQMIASSWGAKELLSSAGTTSYWTALEKWHTVQHFYTLGYVPTKQGWKQDCYQLAFAPGNEVSLFERVRAKRADLGQEEDERISKSATLKRVHESAMRYCQNLCKEPEDPLLQRKLMQDQKQLGYVTAGLRQTHYERLQPNLNAMVKQNLLLEVEQEVQIESFFQNTETKPLAMRIFHGVIVAVIVASGFASYWYIAKPTSLSSAVEQGIGVLGSSNVDSVGWVFFVIFWLCVFFYFHREMIDLCASTANMCGKFCACCKKKAEPAAGEPEDEMETVFKTPDGGIEVGVTDADLDIVDAIVNE